MPLVSGAEDKLLGMGFTKIQCDQAASMLGDDCDPQDAIQFIFAAMDDVGSSAAVSGISSEPMTLPQLKMMLVVRRDLGMSVGKTSSQCSHAALGCERAARARAPEYLAQWIATGEAIVCVSAESQTALISLREAATSASLVTHTVSDAGRTEVSPGTVTVLAIGPGPVQLVDTITRHLKLL